MTSRETVLNIFRAALEAVLPADLINASLSLEGDNLRVKEKLYFLDASRGIHVLGSGKAALASARAVEALLGVRIAGGLIISPYPGEGLARIEILESSHPVPTEKSIRAAELMMQRLAGLGEDDFFLYLLSGGSSSLVEKPRPPVTLAALQETAKAMLRGGLPVDEMNVVRKHLSLIKGGNLGRATRARGVVLVISDVIGDKLDAIGSAPLFCDRSTFQEACNILRQRRLWPELPAPVRDLLTRGLAGQEAETPKEPNPRIDHWLIGSNLELLKRAGEKGRELGLTTHIMSSRLRGEAKEVAKAIVALGEEIMATGNPFPPPVCLLFGGETTVTVQGSGKGGRNQEMSLAALQEIGNQRGLVFLSAGSDGIDGNSGAAGAVADHEIYQEARRLGLDIRDYLERNDSHEFFRRAGGLVTTGPTGTNVMDMTVLFVGQENGEGITLK